MRGAAVSVRLMNHLVRDGDVNLTDLSSGARFLLMIYCQHADNRTHIAYPGTPRLVRLTGLRDRQVQRYVQELRSAGLLRIVENRGGRRHFASYEVTIGLEPTMSAEAAEELDRMKGGRGSPAS